MRYCDHKNGYKETGCFPSENPDFNFEIQIQDYCPIVKKYLKKRFLVIKIHFQISCDCEYQDFPIESTLCCKEQYSRNLPSGSSKTII